MADPLVTAAMRVAACPLAIPMAPATPPASLQGETVATIAHKTTAMNDAHAVRIESLAIRNRAINIVLSEIRDDIGAEGARFQI